MIILVWSTKEFVIWKATVQEKSMLPALESGETVWINKINKPQRNELGIFDLAMNTTAENEIQYLKRCIGIPGDTVEVINQRVFVNSQELATNTQCDYLIQCDANGLSKKQKERFNLQQGGAISANKLYKFSMLDSLAQLLEQEENVLHMSKYLNGKGVADPLKITFAKKPKTLGWNLDQFGPLYCPKKDDRLPFTKKNFNLYQSLLAQYEKVEIKFFEEQGYVDNVLSTSIPFKQNYYFFLGDNRHHSKDSRNFGLVPEENIVGTILSIHQ